jgi:sigma-B regulation protein RsbU (phosphoserine phosphatase)
MADVLGTALLPPDPGLETIAPAAVPPGRTSLAGPAPAQGQGLHLPADVEALARWMETVLALQRSSADPAEFYGHTTRAMIDTVGLDMALLLRREGDGWRTLNRACRPGAPEGAPEHQFSLTVLDRLKAERRTFYQENPHDVNAVVASPVFGARDEVVGALYGLRLGQADEGDARIRPLEAQLVQLLATAVSVNETRMTATQIERELQIGREIQRDFLPEQLPRLPGWELASYFKPAGEVSGDFYDVFPLSGDHVAFFIGDVSGKGVGATLWMTMFRSLLRAFAQQTFGSGLPGEPGQAVPSAGVPADRDRATLLADRTALSAVGLTNDYVVRTHETAGMFATLFFGVLDTTTGMLSYVNGGLEPPVRRSPGGVKERLSPTGPAVGILPGTAFAVQRAQLGPGDTLFAYTDGVTEARNPAGEFFSEKRLLALLATPVPSATALLEGVIARLDEHVAGHEPSDDVTMLAIRRSP